MRRPVRLFGVIVGTFALSLALTGAALAATATQQREDIRRGTAQLKTAVRLAKQDRAEEALAAFQEASEKIVAAGEELDPRLERTFARANELIDETRAELTQLGLKVPTESARQASSSSSDSPTGAGGMGGSPAGDQVSFASQVAPLFVSRCGQCHVDGARGGVSLATYNSLIRGSNGGAVLTPGESGGALLDSIESGSMPPGPQKLSAEEIALVSRWVTAGARFDGDNQDANLRELRPAPTPPPSAASAGMLAGEVSFAEHVAPVLMQRCASCHVNAERGGLGFPTFTALMDSAIVEPGDPAASSLVQRLTPDSPGRMPPSGPPLSEEERRQISEWVAGGARFDGQSPETRLNELTRVAPTAAPAAGNQIAARQAKAAETWRLGLPDEQAFEASTERFLLMGALPATRLTRVGETAEYAAKAVQKLYGLPEGAIGGGPVTLYVFGRAIDYQEFVRMVEKREIGAEPSSHAVFSPAATYACVLIDPEAEAIEPAAVAQAVAGAVLAELTGGKAPRWFLDGASMAAVARIQPGSERVKQWEAAERSAVSGLNAPDGFMTGRMPADDAALVSYHFVTGMMRNGKAFAALLEGLHGGKDFEAAFTDQYKSDPQTIAQKWVASVAR